MKDPELQKVVIGLLDGTTTSTKVVRNSEVKAERRDVKLKQQQELEQLKSDLKIALEKKGYSDLNSLYKRFDQNGDGVLSMTEFTCLLTVLKIDFSQENLRKLIRLTDSNNDGRISMNEFDKMISSQR